jgi:hypothetical protein
VPRTQRYAGRVRRLDFALTDAVLLAHEASKKSPQRRSDNHRGTWRNSIQDRACKPVQRPGNHDHLVPKRLVVPPGIHCGGQCSAADEGRKKLVGKLLAAAPQGVLGVHPTVATHTYAESAHLRVDGSTPSKTARGVTKAASAVRAVLRRTMRFQKAAPVSGETRVPSRSKTTHALASLIRASGGIRSFARDLIVPTDTCGI